MFLADMLRDLYMEMRRGRCEIFDLFVFVRFAVVL